MFEIKPYCGPMKLKDRRHTTTKNNDINNMFGCSAMLLLLLFHYVLYVKHTTEDTHRRKFIFFYHSLTFMNRSHNARDKSHAHIAHTKLMNETKVVLPFLFVIIHNAHTHTQTHTEKYLFRFSTPLYDKLSSHFSLSRYMCVCVCVPVCGDANRVKTDAVIYSRYGKNEKANDLIVLCIDSKLAVIVIYTFGFKFLMK